jgi:hypothetical protein
MQEGRKAGRQLGSEAGQVRTTRVLLDVQQLLAGHSLLQAGAPAQGGRPP